MVRVRAEKKRDNQKISRNFLMAFAKFHKRHNDTLLYCHCDPIEHMGVPLHSMVLALDLNGAVFFPPHVINPYTEEQMSQLYNAMDCFVLPTKGEGFGLPIIEA